MKEALRLLESVDQIAKEYWVEVFFILKLSEHLE
jgi:hypothetical protein